MALSWFPGLREHVDEDRYALWLTSPVKQQYRDKMTKDRDWHPLAKKCENPGHLCDWCENLSHCLFWSDANETLGGFHLVTCAGFLI